MKSQEVLLAEMQKDIESLETRTKEMSKRVTELRKEFKELKEAILPKIRTWDNTSANVSKGVWIVVSAVIAGMLALVIQ